MLAVLLIELGANHLYDPPDSRGNNGAKETLVKLQKAPQNRMSVWDSSWILGMPLFASPQLECNLMLAAIFYFRKLSNHI
jgi:hypothetical protein